MFGIQLGQLYSLSLCPMVIIVDKFQFILNDGRWDICRMETIVAQYFFQVVALMQGQHIETHNKIIRESFSLPVSIQPWSFMHRQKSPSVSMLWGSPLWWWWWCAHSFLTVCFGCRNFYYITMLRDPVSRYLSEWKHVQRGATWKTALHMCDGRSPHPGWAAHLLQRGRLVRCHPDGVHELPVQPGQQPAGPHAGWPQPGGLLQPVLDEREPAEPHPVEQRHEQLEEHGVLRPDGVSAQDAVPVWADVQPAIHLGFHADQQHASRQRGPERARAQTHRGAQLLGRAVVRVRKGLVPPAFPVHPPEGAPGGALEEARGEALAEGAEGAGPAVATQIQRSGRQRRESGRRFWERDWWWLSDHYWGLHKPSGPLVKLWSHKERRAKERESSRWRFLTDYIKHFLWRSLAHPMSLSSRLTINLSPASIRLSASVWSKRSAVSLRKLPSLWVSQQLCLGLPFGVLNL